MIESTLMLVDGTEINLEEGASLGNMRVIFADRASMVSAWEKLTPGNLARVQIMTGGEVSGYYRNMVLEHETSTVQEDGSILTAFAIREKTAVELMMEELVAIKAEQSIQDGAIAELGAITPAVAEKVEGGVQQ